MSASLSLFLSPVQLVNRKKKNLLSIAVALSHGAHVEHHVNVGGENGRSKEQCLTCN